MARHTSSRAEWAALAFAGLFPTFATWLYFVALPASGWSQPAFAATKLLQFAFPLVWAWGIERDPVRPGRFRVAGLGLGMLSGLAIVALQAAGYSLLLAGTPLVRGARAVIGEKLAAFGIDTPAGFLLLALFYSAVHSLLEEYYWRWFLFGRLRRRMPAAAAVAVSSLAFTAHHVLVIGEFAGGYGLLTWVFALTVTGAGAFWAWLYERTGSLGGPWLSHALADAGDRLRTVAGVRRSFTAAPRGFRSRSGAASGSGSNPQGPTTGSGTASRQRREPPRSAAASDAPMPVARH